MKARPTAFPTLIIRAFSELWLHSRSVSVGKLIVLTFLWGGLLIAMSVLAQLTGTETQTSAVLQIGTLVFFLLMAATWIALTLKQTQVEFEDGQSPREIAAGVIAILPTLGIGALLLWAVVSFLFVVLGQPLDTSPTDFTTCQQAGGVILEVQPRQCILNRDAFVQE